MAFYIFFVIVIWLLTTNIAVYGNNGFCRLVKQNKNILCSVFIILVTIFRFDVGYDYPVYYDMVKSYPTINIGPGELLSRFCFFLAHESKYPPLLFILFGILTYMFNLNALKLNSVDFSVAIISYIAFIYTTDLSNVRQSVAVAICFYGFKYIKEHKILKYLFFCALAFLFQQSAIFAIPIYFIYNYFNLPIFIATILFIAFAAELLLSKFSEIGIYSQYLNILEDAPGGSISRYVIIAWVAIFLLIDVIHRNLKKNQTLYFIIIVGLILPIVFGGHFGGRVARYYIIYICILIPNVLSITSLRIRTSICALLLLYFMSFIYVDRINTSALSPYKTILSIDYKSPHFKEK